VFYKHVRRDGGIRLGVEVDDVTAFHHFLPGSKELNPALLWWVDLRCYGRKLPDDPEEKKLGY
jgi:hypothetical protein